MVGVFLGKVLDESVHNVSGNKPFGRYETSPPIIFGLVNVTESNNSTPKTPEVFEFLWEQGHTRDEK